MRKNNSVQFSLILLLLTGVIFSAKGELSSQKLSGNVIAVHAYQNKKPGIATGLVVQSDRYNGYVLTNAEWIVNADTITVTDPLTGAEMIAQTLQVDTKIDLALLKVNGLNLPPISFSQDVPLPGDVVWSAVRWDASRQPVGLARGNLRNTYRLQDTSGANVISHSAIVGSGDKGSVLLNDCGEVIGFNMTFPSSDGNSRAIAAPHIKKFLSNQSVKSSIAGSKCVSATNAAREKAEIAKQEAEQARKDATEAQRVARSMEAQLQASDQRNEKLVREATAAKRTAEAAIVAAAEAQKHAEQTRIDLEKQTASIVAETEAMVQHLQEDRDAAEARFEAALDAQRQSALKREDFLIMLFTGLVVVLVVIFFVVQRWGFKPAAILESVQPKERLKSLVGHTVMHKPALEEYVLDGRDEDGIRYLLRISGDQLTGDEGIIIGRNPNESPYIINHSDVSRQHARLKVMKNRVFIEDLGSTNGTSVNGQNIDEKGMVSVSNGDQIIIGSVVMKLRVMGA